MKKRFNLKNLTGRKNILLTVVALTLVMILVVGVSYSWIEQISNVEFEFPSGVENPMHISTDRLNQPAEAVLNGGKEKVIDLSRYFYESGNMHLSSCYSDGNTFYFPNQKQTGASSGTTYRLGTKDDANVNYISVSFKITNKEDYDQVYWFDKDSTFFKTKSSADTVLDKLIRCSMTVDGATSVFSASDTPEYKTIESIKDSAPKTNPCQSFKAYQYDPSLNNQSDVSNNNYSSTRGANGNVLFTLAAGRTSTVNIKVWLEYDSVDRSASLSDINMKLVSSFTKTRKIYITDDAVYNTGSEKWLRKDNAKLYFAVLKEHKNSDSVVDYYEVEEKWQLKRTSDGKTSYSSTDKNFYVEIPAYYNNWKAVLLRCSNLGYAQGNKDVKYNDLNVKYNNGTTNVQAWNWWETTLPDTYDNRTFTEYTPNFGSWYDSSKVGHVFFAGNWGENTKAYLWDDSTVIPESDAKVVENASFPGETMYNVTGELGQKDGKDVYVVYYDTDYTHVIFSNNGSDKTTDLPLVNGRYYSLADTALQWKYYGTNDNTIQEPKFIYEIGNGGYQYTYLKLEKGKTLNFKVHDTFAGRNDYLGANSENNTYNLGDSWTLNKDDSNWINLYIPETCYYLFEWQNNTITVKKASEAASGGSGGSGGSSGGGDPTAWTIASQTGSSSVINGTFQTTSDANVIEFKFSPSMAYATYNFKITNNGTEYKAGSSYQLFSSGASITLSTSGSQRPQVQCPATGTWKLTLNTNTKKLTLTRVSS